MPNAVSTIGQAIQWSRLPHMDEVAPIGDKDRAVLEELREVILRHGYGDRFGVCLLHRHFPMDPQEVLVETTDESARMSAIEVCRRGEVPSGSFIETMWHFVEGETNTGTECRLMCDYAGGHKRVHRKVAV